MKGHLTRMLLTALFLSQLLMGCFSWPRLDVAAWSNAWRQHASMSESHITYDTSNPGDVIDARDDTRHPKCFWHHFKDQKDLTSWEFEVITPLEKFKHNDRASRLQEVAELIKRVAREERIPLHLKSLTLRTSVINESSSAFSTVDGRPLPEISDRSTSIHKYPWHGPGFFRIREYLRRETVVGGKDAVGQAGRLQVRPGRADLTLKIKDVDPETFPPSDTSAFPFPLGSQSQKNNHAKLPRDQDTKLPEGLEPASIANSRVSQAQNVSSGPGHSLARHPRLAVKLENDVYCWYANRVNYEAKFAPVKPGTDITTLEELKSLFPNLASYLHLDERRRLPAYNQRVLSKSVWDITVAGAPGVANMVFDFNTPREAIAGKKAYLGELSFRIKRSAVSAGRTPFGPHRAIAEMCMALKKRGWDSPPMSLYEN